MGDTEDYWPTEERRRAKASDPIPRFHEQLLADGVLTATADEEIRYRAQALVDEAVVFARESNYSAPEAALEKVFV